MSKRQLQYGDIVQLTPKAVKYFYGTEDCVRAYEHSDGMRSGSFVDFVWDQLGFENGKSFGIVIGDGADSTFKQVKFFCVLGWKSNYYSVDDLKYIDLD